MTFQEYTPDQEDALQEVVNIAMGQAGAALAQVLDVYVALSVPRVRIVSADGVADAVQAMIASAQDGDPGDVTAVRQGFFNSLRGESIALFGTEGCNSLADLMGHEQALEKDEIDRELLLEVSNILSGAVLNGVAEQLDTDFAFSAPTLMAMRQPVNRLLDAQALGWDYALLVEVNFRLEAPGFSCHLVLLMPEESIEFMRRGLDAMLEGL
ncbi:chemotaxis protein CheC [Aquisalimonas lutea]|uniref:chemotaxis protein CheC n=1 Tax=Aquisalimonas lutea TaxID=1327750 RepID=UPI0025B43922|nr:chemotaxis protein CheC [Aquisalimonas lutea]MDN3518867.1 chemotaxis protein CheC [Aquisalimonas lutea]